jgi:hypothetical protein
MELKQSRGTIILSCIKCGKEFNRQACQHRANLRRGRTKTFCSTKCAGREHRKPFKVKTEPSRIKAARESFREACLKCKERSLAVIETKITAKGYRRRRKSCLECGYRMTTIEMPIEDVKNKVDTGIKETISSNACTSCEHNENEACGFFIPEYMTNDSHDCNLYSKCA